MKLTLIDRLKRMEESAQNDSTYPYEEIREDYKILRAALSIQEQGVEDGLERLAKKWRAEARQYQSTPSDMINGNALAQAMLERCALELSDALAADPPRAEEGAYRVSVKGDEVRMSLAAYHRIAGGTAVPSRGFMPDLGAETFPPLVPDSEGREPEDDMAVECVECMDTGVSHVWSGTTRKWEAIQKCHVCGRTPPTEDRGSWRPIETAPKDGTIIRVFSPYLLDEDFNPSGSTEAQWVPDLGWQGAVWDPCHDTWKAATLTHATHWLPLPTPPSPEGDEADG